LECSLNVSVRCKKYNGASLGDKLLFQANFTLNLLFREKTLKAAHFLLFWVDKE
jgi:hypothetical protein